MEIQKVGEEGMITRQQLQTFNFGSTHGGSRTSGNKFLSADLTRQGTTDALRGYPITIDAAIVSH